MIPIGSMVAGWTRRGLHFGLVVARATREGGEWRWGAYRFEAGPYVVICGKTMLGFCEDDLTVFSEDAVERLRRAIQGGQR